MRHENYDDSIEWLGFGHASERETPASDIAFASPAAGALTRAQLHAAAALQTRPNRRLFYDRAKRATCDCVLVYMCVWARTHADQPVYYLR